MSTEPEAEGGHLDDLPREDRIYAALLKLSAEVLDVRAMLVPVKRWETIAIIVLSSFIGGVVTNIVFYLLGLGTVVGFHR